MYCRKCGKFIEYEGEICKECVAKESQPEERAQIEVQTEQPITVQVEENVQIVVNQEPVSVIAQPKSNKSGFGMALAATIVGAVSRGLSSIAETVLMVGADYIADVNAITPEAENMFYTMAVIGGIILALAIGGAVPAIVMGIKSIIAFARGKKNGSSNASTLVLGIIGIALAMAVVFSILTYCLGVVNFVTLLNEMQV